jgi:hypothetical protein|uniref:hypothetical protein n=1 Tax=Enterocloster clostridioformis TaxID=1531 RepID=UPI0025A58199|nr:hypothetical protein [Enterocloster clostridioformis]
MTFEDIKSSEIREKIFPMVLEEACRQWCDGLADAPERADGEGFAEFFYEIFQEKELEYAAQVYEMEAQETVKTPKEKSR